MENKPYPRPPDIVEMSMSLGVVVSLIHHCHMLVQTDHSLPPFHRYGCVTRLEYLKKNHFIH